MLQIKNFLRFVFSEHRTSSPLFEENRNVDKQKGQTNLAIQEYTLMLSVQYASIQEIGNDFYRFIRCFSANSELT